MSIDPIGALNAQAVSVDSHLVGPTGGHTGAEDQIITLGTHTGKGVWIVDLHVRASSTNTINSVVAIGADTSHWAVDFIGWTDVHTSLPYWVVLSSICAVLAPVVD